MEKLIAGGIGAVIGFLMPYGAKAWETMTRTRRMTSALENELKEISREIQEKMKWVERDVSQDLGGMDPSRIVDDLKKIESRLTKELARTIQPAL